jgi:hypothetical protein
VYAGAARSSPFGPNCGSQKRFRFGSFPMMKFVSPGTWRASDAAWAAKLAWSASLSGVVRDPNL